MIVGCMWAYPFALQTSGEPLYRYRDAFALVSTAVTIVLMNA